MDGKIGLSVAVSKLPVRPRASVRGNCGAARLADCGRFSRPYDTTSQDRPHAELSFFAYLWFFLVDKPILDPTKTQVLALTGYVS